MIKRKAKIKVQTNNGIVEAVLTFNTQDLTIDEANHVRDKVTDAVVNGIRTNTPYAGYIPLTSVQIS